MIGFALALSLGCTNANMIACLNPGAIIGNNIAAKDVGIVSCLQYNLLAFKGAALSGFVMALGFVGNNQFIATTASACVFGRIINMGRVDACADVDVIFGRHSECTVCAADFGSFGIEVIP